MKYPIYLFTIVLLISCTKENTNVTEMQKLKLENDSLKAILKNKFVFDDVKVRMIPSAKNTNEIGSIHDGEFVIIAYNKADSIEFSTQMNDKDVFINPQNLKRHFGGYKYSFPLTSKETEINFHIKTKSKIGFNWVLNSGTFSDVVKVK